MKARLRSNGSCDGSWKSRAREVKPTRGSVVGAPSRPYSQLADREGWENPVNSNTTVSKEAHPAYYRRVWGAIGRSGRPLRRGAALTVIVLLALGLWGFIWLAVVLLASIWER